MDRCPKDEPTAKNLVCKKLLPILEKKLLEGEGGLASTPLAIEALRGAEMLTICRSHWKKLTCSTICRKHGISDELAWNHENSTLIPHCGNFKFHITYAEAGYQLWN